MHTLNRKAFPPADRASSGSVHFRRNYRFIYHYSPPGRYSPLQNLFLWLLNDYSIRSRIFVVGALPRLGVGAWENLLWDSHAICGLLILVEGIYLFWTPPELGDSALEGERGNICSESHGNCGNQPVGVIGWYYTDCYELFNYVIYKKHWNRDWLGR